MPGLYIPVKSYTARTIVLLFVSFALFMVAGLFGWLAWNYYMTGAKPPVFGSALNISNSDISETPVTDKQRNEHTVPADQPRYISVPSLNLSNVRVFAAGLTKDGALDAPRNIYDAAWYENSAYPGDGTGVVLIDAHNGGVSGNGIFAQLSRLTEGDSIVIERGDGEKIRYIVATNRTLTIEEANKTGMKEILSPVDADKEGLGLITCAGRYVPRLGQYSHRVMVRAVRADT